jgi:hypothetical protein
MRKLLAKASIALIISLMVGLKEVKEVGIGTAIASILIATVIITAVICLLFWAIDTLTED